MDTVEYAPGRLTDLFGDPAERAALLWHGTQSNARASMRPLAELLAGHGVGVIVPDWDSHAEDGGRADLLESLAFASRRAAADSLVLVGWSLGGVAAAGLTIHASEFNAAVSHTVCLAGAFMVGDPITQRPLPTELPDGGRRTPFTLLHGGADDVVPVGESRRFGAVLDAHDWPVEVVELPTDHGAIAGAVYDPVADRYSAARDPATLAVAADVAARIAVLLGS